jgi:hypothetical protein
VHAGAIEVTDLDSIVWLSKDENAGFSVDVQQEISVPTTNAQEIPAVHVKFGRDRGEHQHQLACSAFPHRASPDVSRLRSRAALPQESPLNAKTIV